MSGVRHFVSGSGSPVGSPAPHCEASLLVCPQPPLAPLRLTSLCKSRPSGRFARCSALHLSTGRKPNYWLTFRLKPQPVPSLVGGACEAPLSGPVRFRSPVSHYEGPLDLLHVFNTPHALRALLRCDFTARSESKGCSCAHFPRHSARIPSRVVSQSEV
jgi:hypothetical protein